MKIQPCEVPECGGRVSLIEADGAPVAVNPNQVRVIVQDSQGHFHWATGFLPHALTCVDITHRLRNRGHARVK